MKQMKIIKEFCAENFTYVPDAAAAGAKRIELCDNLAAGGTTPCYGVIKKTVNFAKENGLAVMTMIRPRGGNFEYNEAEVQMMLDDAAICAKLGSTGIVWGCLKNEWLDEELAKKLIEASCGMENTYHMAFDLLSENDQFRAIDWLAKHGVKRILTHGGTPENAIEKNYSHLKKLIGYADNRIIILPGGGINFTNADAVIKELNITEVHGTKIVKIA